MEYGYRSEWEATGFIQSQRIPFFAMNLVQSDAEIIIDNWNSTVLLQVTMDLTTGVNRHTFYVFSSRNSKE